MTGCAISLAMIEPIALVAQAAAAQAQLTNCTLCPHRCGTPRATGSGVCRVGQASYIASEMLHMGEEAPLAPAHAIFFSGCTATCRFCTAARFAFHPTYGVVVTPAQLAARILQRQAAGARSVCFIGGDPAPHIPFILATLAEVGDRRTIPAVFNSNFYLTDDALDLLAGAVEIYLPDLKFGPPTAQSDCGLHLGGMPTYWPVVTGAIRRVWAQGDRLIVRHLLMPGHFACCTQPVLTWLAGLPGVEVSLLTQYLAPATARGALAAGLDAGEIAAAHKLAADLRLTLVR
jgi:putative pyruvate formate lyase activating enzyme